MRWFILPVLFLLLWLLMPEREDFSLPGAYAPRDELIRMNE